MKNTKGKRAFNSDVYELKISLLETEPLVWRKVLAHNFIGLDELHMLIQISMGWMNSHLYSFDINGKMYSDSETASDLKNTCDGEGILLCDVLGSAKNFQYIYDFGDNWIHQIEICNILETDPRMNYPICIGGENACPPEDCGGISGFDSLKALLSGKDSEERDELITWLGGFYDPSTFDPNFVNRTYLWDDEF